MLARSAARPAATSSRFPATSGAARRTVSTNRSVLSGMDTASRCTCDDEAVVSRRFALLLLIVAAACSCEPAPKRYPIQGEVKALDTTLKSATIAHGRIGDW